MCALYPVDPAECLTPRSIKEAREIARATGRDFPAGDWLDESAPIDQRFDVLAVIVAAFAALAVAVYLA